MTVSFSDSENKVHQELTWWKPKDVVAPASASTPSILSYWNVRDDRFHADWNLKLQQLASRRLRRISPLDRDLQSIHVISQRVIPVAMEHRNDRTIIGIDLRGACSYAVAYGKVPNPALLEKIEDPNQVRWDDPTYSGYYYIRATPKETSTWIGVEGPFKKPVFGIPVEPFESWIHTEELNAWREWFEVQFLYGYQAPAMDHPLNQTARTLWSQQTNDPHWKKMLSTMHTALGQAHAKGEQGPYANACWSAHWMPLAWVRGKWLATWKKIQDTYSTALLCYANVDSMHISIDNAELEQQPWSFSKEDCGWGEWKTQWVAQKGLWLNFNKYWVYTENGLVNYKNQGGAPWQTKRRIKNAEQQLVCSAYLWHGLTHYSTLQRKEKQLVIQKYPPLHLIRSPDYLNAALTKSIWRDRGWKKKLWFISRGYNEKT